MSDNAATMDEKYFDLQYKLIDTKLAGIGKSLEDFGKDVKKILDDHELRLREQAKVDAANAQENVTLRISQKDLQQEVTTLRIELTKLRDDVVKDKQEGTRKELSLWQTVAFEMARVALFGASGGGAIVGLIKILGIQL